MRTTRLRFRFAAFSALLAAALPIVGCLGEESFPMVEADLIRPVAADFFPSTDQRPTTREWAVAAHKRLHPLLPASAQPAMTTDEMAAPAGGVADVGARFGLNPAHLDSIFFNFKGILHTAQVLSGGFRNAGRTPTWPGFTPVEIPMDDGLKMCARWAPPTGTDLGGSWVVIAHGLFGSIDGADPLNHAEALRAFGHHVLAIEMRGHGDTNVLAPAYPIEFGVTESRDLLATSRWLRQTQQARRVGLVTFCSTSHHALITAWLDGRDPTHEDKSTPIFGSVAPPLAQPAFNAGILAVSPPVDLVATTDRQDVPHCLLCEPAKASLTAKTEQRMQECGYPISHVLWKMVEHELCRSQWKAQYPDYPALIKDVVRFVNFHADDWREGVRRMERVRSPLLILHAANDPLAPPQEVADLFGRVRNPNCAVIMLARGGHTGFPALSAPYYYSLMRAFFDPATAPRAVAR